MTAGTTRPPIAAPTPLAEAITLYAERIKERNRGSNAFPRTGTAGTYFYALRAFLQYLSDTRGLDDPLVADLAVSDLAEYTRWLRKQSYQDKTQENYVTAARGLLRFLVRRKALTIDFDEAVAEWEEDRPRLRYPTPVVVDEADRILALHRSLEPPRADAAASRRERLRYLGWLRDQALLEVLFTTAARISEVLSLQRRDVRDGKAKQVTVRGKGDKDRVLPLNEGSRQAITAYLAARNDTQPALFISHAGRSPGQPLSRMSAWQLVAGLARTAELEGLSPHGIRRWLATMVLRDGANLKTISSALGHSSTAVTEKVYAFVAQEQVAAAWGEATDRVHRRRQTAAEPSDSRDPTRE